MNIKELDNQYVASTYARFPLCITKGKGVLAYDENGKVNAMNAAWGGISEETQISICVDDGHKTAIANGGVFRKNDINDALILSKVKEGDIM